MLVVTWLVKKLRCYKQQHLQHRFDYSLYTTFQVTYSVEI